jgi:MoaA/NifB/PqqE/SkfB family radical SAM enzyme
MSNPSLLRQESFGGTLFNAFSGKRTYVTIDEYLQMETSGTIPENLHSEIQALSNTVLFRKPQLLPSNNFSAPDTVFFEVTRACNLTCVQCLNNSGKRLTDELSDYQRLSIIENLCESGVQEIRFTGGEPLVIPAVLKYISTIHSLGLRASIGTNGTIITPNLAERLASAGLNSAIVSIDGMEMQHDLIRGRGSFQKTITGIQSLIKAGVSVRINTVAMKRNLQEIPTVVRYFSDQSIPIMIRRFIPSGRATQMKEEMLTIADYNDLREALKPLLNDPEGLVRGHYLQDENAITRISLPFDRRQCSAGHRGLVILPNGNVQTCGFLGPLGESPIGNIATEKLASIWQRLLDSEHICSLESLLPEHNASKTHPKTNCLAIALAIKSHSFVTTTKED